MLAGELVVGGNRFMSPPGLVSVAANFQHIRRVRTQRMCLAKERQASSALFFDGSALPVFPAHRKILGIAGNSCTEGRDCFIILPEMEERSPDHSALEKSLGVLLLWRYEAASSYFLLKKRQALIGVHSSFFRTILMALSKSSIASASLPVDSSAFQIVERVGYSG